MAIRPGKPRVAGFSRGCVIALVVVGLLMVLIAGGLFMVYWMARSCTSDQAVKVPAVQVSDEQYQEVRGRFEALRAAVEGKPDPNNPEGRFEVSAEDLNTMIARDPELGRIKDKFHLSIENNQLKVQTSVPLKDVPGFRDRYLNGTIRVAVAVDQGRVQFTPQAIQVGGGTAPAAIEESFKRSFTQGFEQALRDDPKAQAILKRIESLRIEDNRIRIHIPPPATKSE